MLLETRAGYRYQFKAFNSYVLTEDIIFYTENVAA